MLIPSFSDCSGIQFYLLLSPYLCIYLLFISWFILYWRSCIDMLGVFHANQISMCLDPHLNLGWGWRAIKPGYALKYNIFTVDSKSVLLLWSTYVISVLFLLCFSTRLFIDALWWSAGKGLTSWLLFVISNCEVVTFPLVSWVKCVAWLYRFQIIALFLTLFIVPLYLLCYRRIAIVCVCVRACVCYYGYVHV